MPTSEQIEQISIEVIRVLYKRFENFPEDTLGNRNAPFHKAFLKAFQGKLHDKVGDIPTFVSLSSWMHGLNTTLGQTFFEKVAHILSSSEKREYTSKKLGNLKIHKTQKDNINLIADKLSINGNPNLVDENNGIFINDNSELVKANDFSADVFIDDGLNIIAIELKSVKPNSGEVGGEKRKILNGKAAFFNKFPNHTIYFYLGFPFDPTNADSDTGCDKNRFMNSVINLKKFFTQDEILLASELWNCLSGEDETMEQILSIISSIANTDFLEKFLFINDTANKSLNANKYREILEEWNLFSEINFFDYETVNSSQSSHNNSFNKIYKKLLFKDGKYDVERAYKLKEEINNQP
jgi:hypothetical protein